MADRNVMELIHETLEFGSLLKKEKQWTYKRIRPVTDPNWELPEEKQKEL